MVLASNMSITAVWKSLRVALFMSFVSELRRHQAKNPMPSFLLSEIVTFMAPLPDGSAVACTRLSLPIRLCLAHC